MPKVLTTKLQMQPEPVFNAFYAADMQRAGAIYATIKKPLSSQHFENNYHNGLSQQIQRRKISINSVDQNYQGQTTLTRRHLAKEFFDENLVSSQPMMLIPANSPKPETGNGIDEATTTSGIITDSEGSIQLLSRLSNGDPTTTTSIQTLISASAPYVTLKEIPYPPERNISLNGNASHEDSTVTLPKSVMKRDECVNHGTIVGGGGGGGGRIGKQLRFTTLSIVCCRAIQSAPRAIIEWGIARLALTWNAKVSYLVQSLLTCCTECSTECPSSQYQSSSCSEYSDIECKDCAPSCVAIDFEFIPCSGNSNRVCKSMFLNAS
ncbi:hypothetical protein Ciccas_009166 [Cichlidogyrus casuarinus]|uniref:Uncharacterized protein n=1 Tax=Cichlidogyrus casuarinus TaxID=1844966 RepID=A0ABD2PYU3_9PLAT